MPISKNKTIAFLFPGQGAVPETPLVDCLGTSVETTYNTFATPNTPPLATFQQSTIHSDESAQLGVFNLTLALAVEALNHCQPDIVSGYSSGLYAAMVATGCLNHSQGSEAIRLAYRHVQKLNTGSVMVGVIGLHYAKITGILANLETTSHLSLVNNKSQVIVSINQNELASFKQHCLDVGALNIIPLPFAYPYHVPELSKASTILQTYFKSLHLPPLLIPMVAGSDPECIIGNADQLATLVATQLSQTVWWNKTIQCLRDNGAQTLVVFDPTGTLTRIIRWISRHINTIGISNFDDLNLLQKR